MQKISSWDREGRNQSLVPEKQVLKHQDFVKTLKNSRRFQAKMFLVKKRESKVFFTVENCSLEIILAKIKPPVTEAEQFGIWEVSKPLTQFRKWGVSGNTQKEQIIGVLIQFFFADWSLDGINHASFQEIIGLESRKKVSSFSGWRI